MNLYLIIMVHGGLGAVATLGGIMVVGVWRFRPPKYCGKKKKTMQATIVVWLLALFSGVLLYAILYMT